MRKTGQSSSITYPGEVASQDARGSSAFQTRAAKCAIRRVRQLMRHNDGMHVRVKPEYAVAIIGLCVTLSIAVLIHVLGFPHWLTVTIMIFLTVVTLMLFGLTGLASDQLEREAKLGELLTSPDLHQRFSALSLRLNADEAKQLSDLQEAMRVGAREAQRLAMEIKKYEDAASQLRELKDDEQQTADAVAQLLKARADRLAEIIERKGRRSQWFYLIVGAILGVAVQALAQWIF